MFILTSDITIGGYRAMQPASVEWQCSVTDITDTCTIVLPLSSYVSTTDAETPADVLMYRDTVRLSSVDKCMFHSGDSVVVRLGYDNDNRTVFSGFVRRIDMGDALSVVCEGYASLLADKYFTKSFRTTTLRDILAYITAGTPIKLSPKIDTLKLDNVTFNNASGLKIIEWLQKECACRVCFYGDTVYAGASQYAVNTGSVSLRLGWNTMSAEELKKDTEEAVQINIIEKNQAGTVKRTKSEAGRYSSVREVKVRAGMPAEFLRRALAEMQEDENSKGYEGSVTAFLQPYAEKGMKCTVADPRFPERSGVYFIEEVKGSFSASGGRQTLKLKNYGKLQ